MTGASPAFSRGSECSRPYKRPQVHPLGQVSPALPEKDDMELPDWDHAFARIVADLESSQPECPMEDPANLLRCVSSGYLDGGCSCSASVPADVAVSAWHGELARGEERADRFFRFTWRGEVWRGYGLGDGGIRGVYCPSHNADRDRRALAAGL
jgi:hypothetical protein